MKALRTWILIADGGRARLLQNDGPGKGVEAVTGSDQRNENAPDRDVFADRPGRTFDSAGHGRHGMEPPSSPHRTSKADFARSLMDDLDRKHAAGAFDRLLIVAPPQALGDLRHHLSSALKTALIAEIGKDWTKLRDDEVAQHLGDYLAI